LLENTVASRYVNGLGKVLHRGGTVISRIGMELRVIDAFNVV